MNTLQPRSLSAAAAATVKSSPSCLAAARGSSNSSSTPRRHHSSLITSRTPAPQPHHLSQAQQQTRLASSTRRTQKLLRVQPSPSHHPAATEQHSHIIFDPPSSAPNIYHTPFKFLPPSDPRRKLSAALSAALGPAAAPPTGGKLPQALQRPTQKKYHLGTEDFAEIRRLRAEDPKTWTRVKLAERFGCSQFFVGLVAQSEGAARERERELREVKRRWGRGKTEAREDRATRREGWGRA